MPKSRDIRIARRRKYIGELLIPYDVVAIIVDYINDLVSWRKSEDPPLTTVRYRLPIGGDLLPYGMQSELPPLPVPRFGNCADHRYLAMINAAASISVYSSGYVKN